MTPEQIAEALGCDDLRIGESRRVNAPYRDDENPSLNVTRDDSTYKFCDFGIEYSDGQTLAALREHFSGNGTYERSRNGSAAPRSTRLKKALSPLDWWAEYTGVGRDEWEVLGCDEADDFILFEFLNLDVTKRRKRGTKEFYWDGLDATPPLWPLPEDKLPKDVAITEGESDCGVARHLGLHAFAATKGAKGIGEGGLSEDALRELNRRGAQRLLILADADSAGSAFRRSVVVAAHSVGLHCAYVDLSQYCDVTRGENDLRSVFLRHGGDRTREIINTEAIEVERRPFADSFEDVLAWADEEEQWVFRNVIARGTKTVIAAPAKNLKTYLTLHVIACCATCSPLLGVSHYDVPSPMKVCLVEEEGSRQAIGKRVRRVFNGLGGDVQQEPSFRFRRGFSLLDDSQVRTLIEYLAANGIDLLILDPLQRITPGVDENSNSDMRRVWDAVNRILLELPNVAVIVVAHTRKGDSLSPEATRGAGITLGEYDLGVFLQKQDDFTRTDVSYQGTLALTLDGRELPHEYTKAGGAMEVAYAFDYAADTFTMRATGSVVVTVRPTSKKLGEANENVVFEAVRDVSTTTSQGVTKDEVERLTGFAPRTVEKHLAKLTEEGRLTRSEVPKQNGGVKAVWAASGAC
jgi:hypothetical protein